MVTDERLKALSKSPYLQQSEVSIMARELIALREVAKAAAKFHFAYDVNEPSCNNCFNFEYMEIGKAIKNYEKLRGE